MLKADEAHALGDSMRVTRDVDEWKRQRSTVEVSVSCDLCGKKEPSVPWGQCFKLILDCTHSDGYDEYGDTKEAHVCDYCVKDKVVPALKSLGLPVVTSDADKDQDGRIAWWYFDNEKHEPYAPPQN